MAQLPKYNSQRLFFVLAKIARSEFKKAGQEKSWNEIQKWTSANLFPLYVGKSWRQIDRKQARVVAAELINPKKDPKKPCGNAFDVPASTIAPIEYWNIQNTIDIIPFDVQVRVNLGSIGKTDILPAGELPASSYKGYIDELRRLVNNESGAYFEGYVKLVPNAKDDGQNCSYFIDLILFVNDTAVDDTDSIEIFEQEIGIESKELRELRKQAKERREKQRSLEEKKKQQRLERRPKKTKDQKEKEKKQKQQQQQDEKTQKEIISFKIEEFKKLRKQGFITQSEFLELLKEIARKESGGLI